MSKESLIELTKKLYELTLLFPKKEPLRYKTRGLADDILANFVRVENHSNPSFKAIDSADQLLDDLEVIDSYFAIAEVSNWAIPAKLLPIRDDYSRIREYILGKKEAFEVKPEARADSAKNEDDSSEEAKEPTFRVNLSQDVPNARHNKIIEFLKENGQAQVRDFKAIFPEVTKRTLRRDFWFLLKRGTVERMGEKNDTFYRLKSQDSPVTLLS